jgi:hypothetical protein
MAQRLFRYCRERGCNERTNNANGWCDKHQNDNSYQRSRAAYDANRKHDPVWRLYHCAAYTRFKTKLAADGNVVCQRIVDGQRCTRPSEKVHHIISPRKNPRLMYTASNVRCVCTQHHPTTEGEPEENLTRLDEIYVPTIWKPIKF